MEGLDETDGDLKSFRALKAIHEIDATVLLSNGFLARVQENQTLIDSFDESDRAFFDESVAAYDAMLEQEYEANQEYVQALEVANHRTAQLEAQTAELEASREAERKAKQSAEADRDAIKAELESTAQYQMQSDRQRRQFVTLQAHAYPIWGFLFVFLMGTFWLVLQDKEVQALVTILATIAGAMFNGYTGALNSVFAPLMREEKKPETQGKKT